MSAAQFLQKAKCVLSSLYIVLHSNRYNNIGTALLHAAPCFRVGVGVAKSAHVLLLLLLHFKIELHCMITKAISLVMKKYTIFVFVI